MSSPSDPDQPTTERTERKDDRLESITPREAVELHMETVTDELSEESAYARRSQLRQFRDWCSGDDGGPARVTDMTEFTGRDLLRYKHWRQEDVSAVTLRTSLSHLRVFLEFCVTIDAVPSSLPEKVDIPSLDDNENVRDTTLSADAAESIRSHLRQFAYASLDHALFVCCWESGARIGTLHALDVDDLDCEGERIHVRNRPDQGTRLKNGDAGQRVVTLPSATVEMLADYIDVNRHDVTDGIDRRPLFTSSQGRLSKTVIARRLYYCTTPCHVGAECPADRDPGECAHAGTYQSAIECPHNSRPHDIRRGAITHWLREDAPQKAVSDRMDVSEKTLDRHYDKRSEEEKAEQRREFLSDVFEGQN